MRGPFGEEAVHKGGYLGLDEREYIPEFLQAFETSMNYLKLDHVDLLSLHGINTRELLDWSLKKGGCLEAARKLQKEGRCRFIGFSTHATTDIILDTIEHGDFDYINLHWYFVNDLNWKAVQAAHARDMGVFIISPNDKGGKLQEPAPKMAELCAPLTPMQFNDLYCLARPEVHTLSCGASRPTDFDEHVAALKYYDRIQEIEVIFDAGKDRTRVEMIVNAEHKHMFIAHHDHDDAYASIDGCVDKLERQLTDHKEKHRNRKHPSPQPSGPGHTATTRQRSSQ